MNVGTGLFVSGACLALGVALGIGWALAQPGWLRQFRKKLKLKDFNQQWFHNQTVAFHQRVDGCVPDDAVLFMGDSFIQGLCVTAVTDNAINYGVGGDTTEGVLARLPDYASLARASAVVFSVGGNDLLRGCKEAEIGANYRKILARLPEKISVFVCSLTPCVPKCEYAPMNSDAMNLNRVLQELRASREACYFVDLNGALSDDQGFLLPEFADQDGAHLNSRGYGVCIEKLRECLREPVPRMKTGSLN